MFIPVSKHIFFPLQSILDAQTPQNKYNPNVALGQGKILNCRTPLATHE